MVEVEDAEAGAGLLRAEAFENGLFRTVRGTERDRPLEVQLARDRIGAVRDENVRAVDPVGVGNGIVDVGRGGRGRRVGRLRVGRGRVHVDRAGRDVEIGRALGGEGLAAGNRDVEAHGVESRIGEGDAVLAGGGEDARGAMFVRDRPGAGRAVRDADEGGREDRRAAGEELLGRDGEADRGGGLVVFVAADVDRVAGDARVAVEVEGGDA